MKFFRKQKSYLVRLYPLLAIVRDQDHVRQPGCPERVRHPGRQVLLHASLAREGLLHLGIAESLIEQGGLSPADVVPSAKEKNNLRCPTHSVNYAKKKNYYHVKEVFFQTNSSTLNF